MTFSSKGLIALYCNIFYVTFISKGKYAYIKVVFTCSAILSNLNINNVFLNKFSFVNCEGTTGCVTDAIRLLMKKICLKTEEIYSVNLQLLQSITYSNIFKP